MATTSTEVKTSTVGKLVVKNNVLAREFGKLVMSVPEGIAHYDFNKETGEVSLGETTTYLVSAPSINHALKELVPGYAQKLDEYRGIKDEAVRVRKYNNLFNLLTIGVEFEIVAEAYAKGDVFVDELTGQETIARFDGFRYNIVNGNFPEDVLEKIAPMDRDAMLADI